MHARKLTVDDIAKAMGLSIPQVWSLARNMDRAFWPTQRKLVRGKIREIDKPKPQTKRVLRKLHRFLQRRVGADRSAHGGARSRSCFTAARQHLGRGYVVARDVKDAYPSVLREALKHRLCRLGFRADVSLLLSLLCTVRGRLAQGSPVSSDALNLFFFDADRALSAACGSVGARYSRTYDDMVISVNRGSMAEWPGNAMRKEIECTDSRSTRGSFTRKEVLAQGITSNGSTTLSSTTSVVSESATTRSRKASAWPKRTSAVRRLLARTPSKDSHASDIR